MTGIELITAEREEQISKHGFDSDHDDTHVNGELAIEASQLAIISTDAVLILSTHGACEDWGLVKKLAGDRIHQLKVAGALIASEIDRLLRKVGTP